MKSTDGLLPPAPLGLMVRPTKENGCVPQPVEDVGTVQTVAQEVGLVVKLMAYN